MEEVHPRRGRLRRGAGALLVTVAVVGAVTGGYFGLRHDAAREADGGGPAARAAAALAYDPATGDVVMFGGSGASGQALGDTWLWDGSSWTPAAPAVSPPARYGAEMAWDPQSQRLILLDGTGGSGCATGGDGAGSVTSSAGGTTGGGATSSTVGATGGGATSSLGGCAQLQDAWAWDGGDWAQLSLGQGTGQLGSHSLAGASMATDPTTGQIVLVTANIPASPVGPVSGSFVPGMRAASGGSAAATASGVSGGSAGSGGTCIGVDGGPCGSPVALPSGISVPPLETACPLAAGCTSSPCPALPLATGDDPSIAIACAVPCASTASSCPVPCASTASSCLICPEASGQTGPGSGSEVTCSNCPAIAAPCALQASTLTWVFDGTAFQQVAAVPTASPPSGGDLVWYPGSGTLVDLGSGRYAEMGGAAMACPSGAPCPVLPPDQDWAWTGSGWTPVDVTSVGGATPFFEVAPVTDSAAGDIVGLDSAGATWVSNGPASGWVKASPADAPDARADFALAFDGANGTALLFGGDVLPVSSGAAQVAGDTWTWDGGDWTQQAATVPSPTPSGSATPVPSPVDASTPASPPPPASPLPLPSPTVSPLATPSPTATPTV